MSYAGVYTHTHTLHGITFTRTKKYTNKRHNTKRRINLEEHQILPVDDQLPSSDRILLGLSIITWYLGTHPVISGFGYEFT